MDVACEERKKENEKENQAHVAMSLWRSMQRVDEARLVIKHFNVTADAGLQ